MVDSNSNTSALTVFRMAPFGEMFYRKDIAEKIGLFKPSPPKKPRHQFVYLIQQPSSGHIKIGISVEPLERLKGLQAGNSINLSTADENMRLALTAWRQYELHKPRQVALVPL